MEQNQKAMYSLIDSKVHGFDISGAIDDIEKISDHAKKDKDFISCLKTFKAGLFYQGSVHLYILSVN